jgi:hypothetical protein
MRRRGEAGGFKETAEFFAERAAKAKDPDTKQRHDENAEFYRHLAAIVSVYPHGYTIPAATSANRWLNRAHICQSLATAYDDKTCSRRLMELAQMYEGLASNGEC